MVVAGGSEGKGHRVPEVGGCDLEEVIADQR